MPIRQAAGPRAAFSVDGQVVLTYNASGEIRLWSATTSTDLGPPMVATGPVVVADLGPDNAFLVSLTDAGACQLWDAATSRPIGPVYAPPSKILSVAMQPDGRHFVTAHADGHTERLQVPEPISGTHAKLSDFFQLRTGQQLDGSQTPSRLTPDAWRDLLQKYLGREGPNSS